MAKRFEQAVFHFELASKLNPNDPKIIVSAALGLAFMGRNHSAAELLEHAFALTSIFLSYQWSHIATTRFLIGDYTGSVEAANMAGSVIVDTFGWKAAALRKLGQNEEALLSLDQLHQTVSKVWAGPHSPSAPEVVEWFLGAFPMRGERERLDLAMLLRSDP